MDLLSLLAVFGLATFELWAAVPLGLALRLPPGAVSVAAALGAIAGIVVLGFTGERVRVWLLRRFGGERREGRLGRVWERYGVIGLGLLAPLLVGVPVGIALGFGLGAPTKRLLWWMTIGALLCSASLTAAGALGMIGFQAIVR